jgi:hypothetical protein
METNTLKFELTVGRALDDNTLDTITASSSASLSRPMTMRSTKR